MSKYKFITIDQPAGRFYISRINASVLIPICQSDIRTPYNDTGIQRRLNNERVKEIAKYCEKKTAMFPTPIILSGDSNYFVLYSEDEEVCKDDIKYQNLDSGYMEIKEEKIIHDGKYLSIVDGQHRLAGIERSGFESDFDLLVMFVFDTEAYQDADIFSVINRNQKQVSKSLVYDLYGLTDNLTVEKFAHEIVKALNSVQFSLMYSRIKMLGFKTDNFDEKGKKIKQYVSQAALVDELIPMISRDRIKDNKNIMEGNNIEYSGFDSKLVLRKYFYYNSLFLAQLNIIAFYNAWIRTIGKYFDENTIMFKTVGFIGSLGIFKYILCEQDSLIDVNIEEYIGKNMNDNNIRVRKEDFDECEKKYLKILDKVNFNGINVETISSSLSGAKKIIDILKKDIN